MIGDAVCAGDAASNHNFYSRYHYPSSALTVMMIIYIPSHTNIHRSTNY